MNLNLRTSLGADYKNEAQKARVVSEAWVEENAYCCSCGKTLARSQNNARALDSKCIKCADEFELKSTRGNFSNRIPDGAYQSMMDRVSKTRGREVFLLILAKILL